MPMRLDDGWNQIQFNLSDFTRRGLWNKLHRDSQSSGVYLHYLDDSYYLHYLDDSYYLHYLDTQTTCIT